MRCIALILAAGASTRFGASPPKPYHRLGRSGLSLLQHAVAACLEVPAIEAVRVVYRTEDAPFYAQAMAWAEHHPRMLPPVPGGATRDGSSYAGLCSLREYAPAHVLIHDAARPFVPTGVLVNLCKALHHQPAVVPVIPVVDTLKQCEAGHITATIDRTNLYRVQTPQAFHYQTLLDTYDIFPVGGYTDDASRCEAAGVRVAVVPGCETNMKITTEQDGQRVGVAW